MADYSERNSYLADNFNRYLEIYRAMVDINSYTLNPVGVNRLAELTAEIFSGVGFSARFVDSLQKGSGRHLVMTRQGSGRNSVLCVSHLDTVFTEEEEKSRDFRWKLRGSRVYGPGTNDIKGGTVIILMMMELLQRFYPEEFEAVTWKVLLDATEETVSDDFGALCLEEGIDALACLVFEAGKMQGKTFNVVTSRKGRSVFVIRSKGRSAHAGVDHASGANALLHLCDVLPEVAEITDYSRGLTVNVATISGGTVLNRVPDRAEASAEMRAFDPEAMEFGTSGMMRLSGKRGRPSTDGKYNCELTVECSRDVPPWPANKGSSMLLGFWQDAARSLGWAVEPERRGGISDGNWTASSIPTIDGLGPAGECSHCSEAGPDGVTGQEFAELDSFIPRTILNSEAVVRLIRAGGGSR